MELIISARFTALWLEFERFGWFGRDPLTVPLGNDGLITTGRANLPTAVCTVVTVTCSFEPVTSSRLVSLERDVCGVLLGFPKLVERHCECCRGSR
jgi:hypothetical protein